MPPRKLIVTVLLLHALCLMAGLFIEPRPVRKLATLAVQTVTLKPKQVASPSSVQPSTQKQTAAPAPAKQKVVAPVKKAPPPKPPAAKPPTPVKKSPAPVKAPTQAPPARVQAPPTSPVPEVPADLVQKLDEAIAKIGAKPDKLLSEGSISPPLEERLKADPSAEESVALPLFAGVSEEYAAAAGGFFQKLLTLPEKGEVVVEILLSSEGRIDEVLVVRTESEKNGEYLKKQLLHLQLPPEARPVQKTGKAGGASKWLVTFCPEA